MFFFWASGKRSNHCTNVRAQLNCGVCVWALISAHASVRRSPQRGLLVCLVSTGRQCVSSRLMCLQQPAAVCTDITNKAESIPPKGCFFPLFSFISATGLSQYRKLSMDSALLDSRNLTRFLIWGFAVFCSGLEHSAYPCREWQSCLGERVGHRELGETEFSHIFYLPCVQVEGQAAVEGFSPAPISELQYPTVLGLGLTSQSQAKLLFTPKQSFEQLMSHSCSAFLNVLVISPVTRIFWSTLNFWCGKIVFPVMQKPSSICSMPFLLENGCFLLPVWMLISSQHRKLKGQPDSRAEFSM